MNLRSRTLLTSVAGACLLTLGGLGWFARDLLATANTGGARLSLLDLLGEERHSGAKTSSTSPAPRLAPKPPTPLNWKSPLASASAPSPAAMDEPACGRFDPQLSQRLEHQRENLTTKTKKIRTDPSNFGERFRSDAFGNQLNPKPRVIVLHETVYGLNSAINTFITPHPNDDDQVSYHTLIGQHGEIIEAVDPQKRAFGAGNSAFNGAWVVTNPKVGGSINNFALHLSLETPLDGENQAGAHSGYTQAQYDSMALVLVDWMQRFQIPAANITTHQHVDLGGERSDPRSFDWGKLEQRLLALGMSC